MTITLDLQPETEASLQAQAEARGLQLKEYLQDLLTKQATRPDRGRASNFDEFEAELDALAEGSEKMPVLPPEATTREGIYQDHD